MKLKYVLIIAACHILSLGPALAADPIRIGVTTILSGPNADRGQSEQYGIELALQKINEAGGVLDRPVEAFYANNAADPATGIAGVKRLLEDVHVSVLIGALATPVTRAVMPIANAAKVPLVIDISAGQEFFDAAGPSGYDYVFKTSPSDGDVAKGMMQWLRTENVQSVAILADDNDFNRANATAMAQAAAAAGIKVLANEVVAKGTTDLAPTLETLRSRSPDRLITLLSTSSGAFFHAYEQSGGKIPLAGRIDFPAALATLSPQFIASGAFDKTAGISVFTPSSSGAQLQEFVRAYREKYGLMPTQRSAFAFEAIQLVADAINRAGSDEPSAIQRTLKASSMNSFLGGNFKMDEHNHAHTSMQIIGIRSGKAVALDNVGG
ncbi:ABC transporter substrate-binding protein [Rhizobium sp. RCAM05973]|uniref:ABC transporter substrate-binding protein n=1 Tax=Rhizobium sp. RCAM05973 TaxID=2994066 RepID=UPI0022EBFC84|nr:ABC transporter substrate-binding protein [Rhizobium sp. RCAM05973]